MWCIILFAFDSLSTNGEILNRDLGIIVSGIFIVSMREKLIHYIIIIKNTNEKR
ncbi:MAG: hypothetical protein PWQ75_2440 [Methanolobus sp.]|jgi:hypothetical protein|nr:hypothetical protein [Methanolobus sp.]